MTIRKMLTKNRLRRFKTRKRPFDLHEAGHTALPLGAGGATVRLSAKAVQLITEMANRTGQDVEKVIIDSLNAYQANIESGEGVGHAGHAGIAR